VFTISYTWAAPEGGEEGGSCRAAPVPLHLPPSCPEETFWWC